MATIDRRRTDKGELRYRARVRLRGHRIATATFARKADAVRWAGDAAAAIREGRYFKTAEAKKHTLAELVDRYLADVLPTKRTGHQKTAAMLSWWRDQLGPTTLDLMTPALLAEQRDELARGHTYRGGRRSQATCNRYLAVLSHAFSVARDEWGWLEENPLRRVRKLPEPRGRVRFLSDEERGRLLEACQAGSEPRLYPLVVLAIATGARAGELLRLRWADVDLERGRAVLQETKNRERRSVPIVGLAAELLREMKRRRRLDSDLVFSSRRAGAIDSAQTPTPRVGGKQSRSAAPFPQRAWEATLKAAKLDDFRFHDLRHSAASYLAMNGATLAELAEVLGHKTLAMVKRYSHLTEQHTSAVVARMNERIFGSGT